MLVTLMFIGHTLFCKWAISTVVYCSSTHENSLMWVAGTLGGEEGNMKIAQWKHCHPMSEYLFMWLADLFTI